MILTPEQLAYIAYQKTEHWLTLRAATYAQAQWQCEMCKKRKRHYGKIALDAHHLNYRHWTDCTVADMIGVCRRCHYWHFRPQKWGRLHRLYYRIVHGKTGMPSCRDRVCVANYWQIEPA